MGNYRMTGLVACTTPSLTFGIASHSKDPQITEWLGGTGSIDNQVAYMMKGKPRLGFMTHDLAAVASLLSRNPTKLTSLAMYLLHFDPDTGVIKSGSAHDKLILSSGLIVPQSMSFNGGDEPIQVNFDCSGVSTDGLVNPLTVTASQALPDGGAMGSGYTLSALTLGGTAYTKIQTLNFAFGLTADAKVDDGDIYPRQVLCNARQPVLSFTSQDSAAGSILVPSTGTVSLIFKSLTATGRGANTITLTMTLAHVLPREDTGNVRGYSGQAFEVKPIISGANDIFTIAAA